MRCTWTCCRVQSRKEPSRARGLQYPIDYLDAAGGDEEFEIAPGLKSQAVTTTRNGKLEQKTLLALN